MGFAEYQCPNCRKIFSNEEYKINPLCPNCGKSLLPHIPQRYWLFQFNPEIYDWFSWIKEKRETEQWLVSRYAKYICRDDRVVIWSSGKRAGIYALGQVITYPRKNALNPDQAKYYITKNDIQKFLEKPSVTVNYSKVITGNPLFQNKCSNDNILSSMHVFQNREGTNFKLSKKQWNRLLELT